MARSAHPGRITRSLARRRVIARRTAARLAGTGADELINNRRATVAVWHDENSERRAYLAAERSDLIRLAIGGVSLNPPVELPLGFSENVASPEEAFRKIAQGWLEVSGPITDRKLAASLGLR